MTRPAKDFPTRTNRTAGLSPLNGHLVGRSNFIRFEGKRIKLEFDGLIAELDRPDPKAPAKAAGVVINLSAPLPPSLLLAKANAEHQSILDRVEDIAS